VAGPRVPSVRGHVVFIGGYFYDPFFGPYPWWGPAMYPYPYARFSREVEIRRGETLSLNVSLKGGTQ